jgi:hypothetical protein
MFYIYKEIEKKARSLSSICSILLFLFTQKKKYIDRISHFEKKNKIPKVL